MLRSFLIPFLILPMVLYAQLTTTPGQSPNDLVQNVLLGQGVSVSNVTYNGSPTAIGSFNAAGTTLGITNGIVLTTGTIYNNGNGPQGPNDQPGCGIDNNVGGSALLSNIIGGTQTYNASILEFDFIPYSDTVKFKYVFGSDEYPEFAPPNNSSYNDVFGFFISGPGIVGLQNIAKLPNNGNVVSINNVNAITNSQYYNFNGDGNTAPYNANPMYIQYDGFTDVLEAVSRVECGMNYHLIIAVADVGDGQWDSGIFLEANSLSSINPVSINSYISETYFSNPLTLAEGCVTGTVELTRSSNINSAQTIPITVGGSATNNLDYLGIPSEIVFNAGESFKSFTFSTVLDGILENNESIDLTFGLNDPCGNPTPETITFFIEDVQPLQLTLNNPVVECPGDDILVSASVSGGLEPYSYLWSNGSNENEIMVSPSSTGIYWVEVSAECSANTIADSILVEVPEYLPLEISLPNDIVEICPYVQSVLHVNIEGGSGSYTIQWYQNGTPIGNLDSILIAPSSNSQFTVIVSDNCGAQVSDTLNYTITSPPLQLTTTENPEICPGDSIFISVDAEGGFGQYSYYWPHSGAITQGVWVRPQVASSYIVEVSDECQTFSMPAMIEVPVSQPSANFSVLTELLFENTPISFQNQSINGYSYEWFFGDGGYSNQTHPTHTFEESGTYYITLIAQDYKGCLDTVIKPLFIKREIFIYIPNTFIPDNDRYNNEFEGSFIGVDWIDIEIYNRWGQVIFKSNDLEFSWDGTFKDEPVQDGSYPWLLQYRVPQGEIEILTGHINVLR